MSQRILLIIPAYNEEASIANTIKTINQWKKHSSMGECVDYVVVNDGSTDNTRLECNRSGSPVLNLPNNLGIGGAVQTGYKYAFENDYDIAVQFDGDGQHDINSLSRVVTPILDKKADFVIGSRFLEMQSFQTTRMRRLGIKLLSHLIAFVTGQRIKDVTSGFRACNKKVISEFVDYYPTDYPEPETIAILLKANYNLMEVPVVMFERKEGVSSITSLKSVYFMVTETIAIAMTLLRKESK